MKSAAETDEGPAQRPSLAGLIASMLKIGAIGFGGGSALIPIMEKELVDQRRFLDAKAFTLHTVIANITPGALPVKLAALAGGRAHGAWASLLSALAVALPGTLAAVGLIAAFNLLGGGAIRYVEYAAVGIAAFIIVLLLHYVTKVLRSSRSRTRPYVLIMVVSWLLTGANGLVILLGRLVGAELRPRLPALSAVGLIVVALVVIGIYSIFGRPAGDSASSQMGQPLPGIADKLWAVGLFGLAAALALIIGIIAAGSPAARLLGLVSFSTVTSFGGGEAYVGVADGFFVASGLVAGEVFYGQLVPVANALPGPILIKIAAGIGYFFGLSHGGVAMGLLFAACAYLIAIGSCCLVALLTVTAWTKVARSAFMINLGRYILPVICGLLMSTSVSMILANAQIGHEANISPTLVAWLSLLGVGALWAIHRRFRPPDLVLLLGAGALSLVAFTLAGG